MTSSRTNLPIDDLGDFKPRGQAQSTATIQKNIEKISSFPSRESGTEGQINIKTDNEILERFRDLAKANRYRHGEFLAILLDAFESTR